jgi:hypothetical protein
LSNSFSSYSSGRQISPLSESVTTDHFRQVGSFSTAGGVGSGISVPESTSIVFSSSEHVSDEGPRQDSLASRRGSHSSAERCCRISEPSSYSRFLFPPFSCTKEKWENETCDRPLRMWTTSLDLTDAYFHIPISPKFCKFLRFVWEDRIYAFKVMSFGLSTAPLVFTRVFQAVVAHLHSQSILIHSYLDDSLLKNMSQFLLRDHAHFVLGLLLKLGFLISWKKSDLVPSQDFIFLWEHYRTHLGLVFPPEVKKKKKSTISGEHLFVRYRQ